MRSSGADVDGEDEAVKGKPWLAGGLEAAPGGGVANSVETVVRDSEVGEVDVRQGREMGVAQGFPEEV